jgi:hypothetical protein
MNEPENFLGRWSRRKLEAEQVKDEPQRADEAASVPKFRPENAGAADAKPEQPKNEELEFDVSTLPSLDSITAETDIRAFLQKGVPTDLTRAALRRAWTADPNIRDFIEIAENQWDFASGSDLPGFGPLNATPEEVRRMVADAFGELHKPAELAQPAETSASTTPLSAEIPPDPAGQQEIVTAAKDQPSLDEHAMQPAEENVQRNRVDVAMQQNIQDEEYKPLPMRRQHGGALPQ